jgi:DNA-binding beta-propeller fold protein YncE
VSNVTFRTRLTALCSVVLLVCTLIVGVDAGTASAGPPAPLNLRYFAGDGTSNAAIPGPALESPIRGPNAVAFDSSGNAYITSTWHQVFKVTPDGTLSVFAGTGDYGTPTPGPATSSRLGNPSGIAVDSAGNVYFGDGNRVLKVTSGGTLSVFAGTGASGTPTAGPATSSDLASVASVAVDSSGNVYIADADGAVIVKVTPGGTLSIFAGTGSQGTATPGPAIDSDLLYPQGVGVDSSGNVYISDAYASQILKVTSGGTLSVFAGTGSMGTPTPGPATSSDLGTVTSVAGDSTGNVYVTDDAGYIYKITSGGTLSILAGNGASGQFMEGPATATPLSSPSGVAVAPNGDIHFADPNNLRVVRLSTAAPTLPAAPRVLRAEPIGGGAGIFFTTLTNGGATITKYQFSIDGGTTWNDAAAGTTSPVSVTGLTNATTYSVTLRAVNSVGESAASASVTVTPHPTYSLSIFAGSSAFAPEQLALDSTGNLYIADSHAGVVKKVTPGGTLSIFAGTGGIAAPTPGPATSSPMFPTGVAADSSGNLYIASPATHQVLKVTSGGTLSIFAGTGVAGAPTPGPATSSKLNGATSIAVDPLGNLYIADTSNHRVEKVTPGGTLSIIAGTGGTGTPTPGPATSSPLPWPRGIAVDTSGNVFIASLNHVIYKVTAGGTLSVVAGTGGSGAPTPGPATSSNLANTEHIAVDSAGNLYISDHSVSDNSNYVLKVTVDGTLSIIAGGAGFGRATPGPATLSDLAFLKGIVVDPDGNVFVAVDGDLVKLTPPPAVTVPDAPTSLVATPGNGSASISFTAGSDGGAAITKYEYSIDGGTNWADASGISSPVSFSGLTNGVSYTVKLRAVNSAGSGAESDASASFTPATTPSAPTTLVATPGIGSASIAFTAGADGGSAITKYQVKVGTGAWTDAVGMTSPITIGGLTSHVTASIRLRAVNSVGAGASSTFVQVWPRIAGSSLTSVNVEGSSKVRASFAALTPVGGTASHYWVYAYTKGTNTVAGSCRSTAAARSCTVTGLSANTEYDVAVRGFFTLTGSPTVLPTFDSTRQTVRTRNLTAVVN